MGRDSNHNSSNGNDKYFDQTVYLREGVSVRSTLSSEDWRMALAEAVNDVVGTNDADDESYSESDSGGGVSEGDEREGGKGEEIAEPSDNEEHYYYRPPSLAPPPLSQKRFDRPKLPPRKKNLEANETDGTCSEQADVVTHLEKRSNVFGGAQQQQTDHRKRVGASAAKTPRSATPAPDGSPNEVPMNNARVHRRFDGKKVVLVPAIDLGASVPHHHQGHHHPTPQSWPDFSSTTVPPYTTAGIYQSPFYAGNQDATTLQQLLSGGAKAAAGTFSGLQDQQAEAYVNAVMSQGFALPSSLLPPTSPRNDNFAQSTSAAFAANQSLMQLQAHLDRARESGPGTFPIGNLRLVPGHVSQPAPTNIGTFCAQIAEDIANSTRQEELMRASSSRLNMHQHHPEFSEQPRKEKANRPPRTTASISFEARKRRDSYVLQPHEYQIASKHMKDELDMRPPTNPHELGEFDILCGRNKLAHSHVSSKIRLLGELSPA
jgi:hypothetical protein